MRAADVTLEKTMPSSLESERALLGAVLLDDRAIFPATEVLTVEDFYLECHREIFRAMLALSEGTSRQLIQLSREVMSRCYSSGVQAPHPGEDSDERKGERRERGSRERGLRRSASRHFELAREMTALLAS